MASSWDSLQVVKLLVSALTPLAVIIGGYLINRKLKDLEELQWTNHKIMEKRLELFDRVAPQLNDLMSYFTFIGRWKELSPPDVIKLKREMDRDFYSYQPLFSQRLVDEYEAFIEICFQPFAEWGQDAKLLTAMERRKDAFGNKWKADWDSYFAELPQGYDRSQQARAARSAYITIMNCFAEELGVEHVSRHVPSISATIR